VDLLYGNGAFAMTVLLPAAGRMPADVLAGLSPESWSALAGRFAEKPELVEMKVDRPFVFAIRERLSGAVVFLGVMNVIGE